MINLTLEEKQTLADVGRKFGTISQLIELSTECAELQKAVMTTVAALARKDPLSVFALQDLTDEQDDQLISEWADVWICLQYIPIITMIGSCELEEAVHGKLARLKRWLDSDYFETAREIDREWQKKLP